MTHRCAEDALIPPRPPGDEPGPPAIIIRGARQNNLKDLSLELPLGQLTVLTGVSGSGKSSLAFDTVYAEGQRRYIETFSPYARQFFERMDRPLVERIDGVLPAIAIDQANPIRTSRSTVGTMTELNDHLKLLFARAARPYCACGKELRRHGPDSIAQQLQAEADPDGRVTILFTIAVPDNFTPQEATGLLSRQGYTRVREVDEGRLEVVQDRVRPSERGRLVEALEAAFERGHGELVVTFERADDRLAVRQTFSRDLRCPDCRLELPEATPQLFSFNSAVGACPACRGFGRLIGVDEELVIPDPERSLAAGAIRPFQSASYQECQEDLLRLAAMRGIRTDVAWQAMKPEERTWVFEGEGDWEDGVWYGVRRFFDWLESRSYRMPIRVLLSRYRSYRTCPECRGARLRPEALRWRLRLSPPADGDADGTWAFHEVLGLPIETCRRLLSDLLLPEALQAASDALLAGIRSRLEYLCEVGLGYLTLDRQSRTLSGGEAQRINLATALGTSLTHTLFVLDEPSIGLHARDVDRLIGVLRRLRDAGNTLLVVEHDPRIIRAADQVIELGPGPGEAGGQVTFQGPPESLERQTETLTGRFLARHLAPPCVPEASQPRPQAWLSVRGAAAHNLRRLDVDFPLGRLVCLAGVSGSGKSSLLAEVCYPALRQLKGAAAERPGPHDAMIGHEQVDEVILVDQAPIGRSTRSNPATYTGALGTIRSLLAAEPLARERGYTAGTFSFNSGTGRCPACAGSGFEHVEMQFLSDVYLRCPECDGQRYRPEVLEVRLVRDGEALSIADVLDLTVDEAARWFGDQPRIVRSLEPLQALGLGYLRLGQPVPTLSGGEAQRLKLAGQLVEATRRRNAGRRLLFLLDEPTTGLHMADVEQLIAALRTLIGRGHSVIAIEHNLDFIAAADWVIELGPGGGDAGGRLVAAGPPAAIAACPTSPTGSALRGEEASGKAPTAPAPGAPPGHVRILHARENNLRNVSVDIPLGRFTAITGVSGSGKSTIAFDILFAEGQRRYLESLNAYARQFVQPATRPDVDAVLGIPPTVAIEQRTSRGGHKSTVGTVTEVHHFLRLLFARLGAQHCPACSVPIESREPEEILARIMTAYRGRTVELHAPLISGRKGYHAELARAYAERGHPVLRVDGRAAPTADWPQLNRYREHDIALPCGTLEVEPATEEALRAVLRMALAHGSGIVLVSDDAGSEQVFSTERACPRCARGFPPLDPRLFSYNSRHGWCPACQGTGLKALEEAPRQGRGRPPAAAPCPACSGRRLRPDALSVRFQGRSIAAWAAMTVTEAEAAFHDLRLQPREERIARDIVGEITSRLRFLARLGLSHLSLDRSAPTLSGGEAQRIRLAAQLGSNLRGVCYILDEPTIGLHPRDNRLLLDALLELGGRGNTLVVVEHDEETIRSAEHLIDLGPGAGARGGEVVATGDLGAIMANPASLTGRMLAAPLAHPLTPARPIRPDEDPHLALLGVEMNNLKGLDVRVPLGRLVCLTGVSGSGKSTLLRQVLHDSVASLLAGRRARGPAPLHGCREVRGWESLERILEVDQTPIGLTPRSCPATYVGFWDDIRRLFAATTEARLRGYGAARFSFNVSGGRCEACGGQGVQRIEMNFLPDARVVCDVCGGQRFNRETLAIRYRDRSIGEVLAMSVDEAVDFFAQHSRTHRALQLLQDVGLGYLTLGQPSPTLSGGEAQRIRLVTELARVRPGAASAAGRTLYVLDEPTVGLHMADVERLIRVLQRLVEGGASVVLIEHNLDVIAEADWIIDLGPEGGCRGGRIVAAGPPEVIRQARSSHTGQALDRFLRGPDGLGLTIAADREEP